MTFITQIQDSVSVKPEDLQLKPLYEPEKVSFTFETIGWKIIAIILVISILAFAYYRIKKYRRNAYRRDALKKLANVNSVLEVIVLLKMVAIQTFGREVAGPLYGQAWLQFLDNAVKKPLFIPYEATIEEAIYKNRTLTTKEHHEILSNSKKWIRTHAR